MFFFHLPIEIIDLTLSYLAEDELVGLFDLHHLRSENDPYLKMQHMALKAKLSKSNILISNCPDIVPRRNYLSFEKIRYLIKHGIVIKPKRFSFHLDYMNDDKDIARYMDQFLQYLEYFKICSSNINIFVGLFGIRVIDDDCVQLLAPLFVNFNVDCFSLKYNPGHGLGASNSSRGMISLDKFSMSSLKINLLSSSSLLMHMSSDGGCFFCNKLEVLDLSFNAINDVILSGIKFPQSLKHLSLSNNNIHRISEFQSVFRHLTNLETLDLSNNNIICLDLDHRLDYLRLRSLNVSGNLIQSLEFLNKPVCNSLIEINASRNMISHLSKFPNSVKSINLCGNTLAQPIDFKYFPYKLERLDLSSCGLDFGWNHSTSNFFITELIKSLPYVDVLELDGSKFKLDCDVSIGSI